MARKTTEKASNTDKSNVERVVIAPANMRILECDIEGTAPLLIRRFNDKIIRELRDKMELGSTTKKGKIRPGRDYDQEFHAAQYISEEGWCGINAAAFRNACISACRICGFAMTHAKLSIFIIADGIDYRDGLPLVRIIGDPPERSEMIVRVGKSSGKPTVDLCVRPMWRKWGVHLRVRYDAGQFTASDVINLLSRTGLQNGIGEGRPSSTTSAGIGMGTFMIKES